VTKHLPFSISYFAVGVIFRWQLFYHNCCRTKNGIVETSRTVCRSIHNNKLDFLSIAFLTYVRQFLVHCSQMFVWLRILRVNFAHFLNGMPETGRKFSGKSRFYLLSQIEIELQFGREKVDEVTFFSFWKKKCNGQEYISPGHRVGKYINTGDYEIEKNMANAVYDKNEHFKLNRRRIMKYAGVAVEAALGIKMSSTM
jgi:hypothetical protein